MFLKTPKMPPISPGMVGTAVFQELFGAVDELFRLERAAQTKIGAADSGV